MAVSDSSRLCHRNSPFIRLIVSLEPLADIESHGTSKSAVSRRFVANTQAQLEAWSLLVILDGSKALRKAVREMFGDLALVPRCHVHKLRNVLDHLPDR